MSVKETRVDRGKRQSAEIVTTLLTRIKEARVEANLSQVSLATKLGWTQTRYSLFERNVEPITVQDVCLAAAILGFKPALELYRVEEGLRDRGHTRLISRCRELLSPLWHVTHEVPFPTLGDLRSWDLLIRLGTSYRVGVEAETRLRDIQELARRIRQRELHGGVDAILVILSDSAHNRRHVHELRTVLGQAFGTPALDLLPALKAGQPLPGSGVLLI
jgi:transcriptional regulator with XRE-family HTH domain